MRLMRDLLALWLLLGLNSEYTVKYSLLPSGEGGNLTVYPSSCPNTDTVFKIIGIFFSMTKKKSKIGKLTLHHIVTWLQGNFLLYLFVYRIYFKIKCNIKTYFQNIKIFLAIFKMQLINIQKNA